MARAPNQVFTGLNRGLRARRLASPFVRGGSALLRALGPLSIPLLPGFGSDLVDLLGTDTSVSREQGSRDYRAQQLAEILPRAEQIGSRAEQAGLSHALGYGANRFEGLQALQGGIARRRARASGNSLEDLIQEERGAISQMAQQSPPSIAEIYARAGII